jgi:ADP-heptose:LPS heptosyltransferase
MPNNPTPSTADQPEKLIYGLLARGFGLWHRRKLSSLSAPPISLLLLRTHAIGDVLLTTPVIRALKQAWPQTRLSMLVGHKSRLVLEGNPYLDEVLSFPESWWFQHRFDKIWTLTRRLRRYPKEGLILFHASPLLHLWGCLLKAPLRVGFDSQGSGFSLTHKVPLSTESRRYLGDVNLDLVRILGLPAGSPELDLILQADELNSVLRLLPGNPTGRRLVGIAPGGGQNPLEQISVKQWPPGHYVNLLSRLSRLYPIIFVLLGDRHDTQAEEIAAQVAGQGVETLNLRGRTTLRELAAIIKHLDLLITNDSSPLHLAVALKTPVVSLFGPTAAWALCPAGPQRLALQSPAACSPCYPFGRFPGCQTPNCMAAISPEAVTEAAASLLS